MCYVYREVEVGVLCRVGDIMMNWLCKYRVWQKYKDKVKILIVFVRIKAKNRFHQLYITPK